LQLVPTKTSSVLTASWFALSTGRRNCTRRRIFAWSARNSSSSWPSRS